MLPLKENGKQYSIYRLIRNFVTVRNFSWKYVNSVCIATGHICVTHGVPSVLLRTQGHCAIIHTSTLEQFGRIAGAAPRIIVFLLEI